MSLPFGKSVGQDAAGFIRGVDLSHLDRLEQHGAVFRDEGVPGDALTILKNHGANWVRLRLWHSPPDGYNGLERTVEMAVRVKRAGMKFLLDIHYSDTWADPGRQTKPAAWQGAGFEALKDSVRIYTENVVARLKEADALPDMVQVGNEITVGMLWPDGRVGGTYDTPTQWRRLSELIRAGVEGVRAADSVEVMIHIDRGGSSADSRWFFDNLAARGVDFDVIGLSFYPWWHGRLVDVESNLAMLASRYGKDIVIVETAYPWTLDWGDNEHNIVGLSEHLHPGYPASVAGQRAFLDDLFAIVRNVPAGKGRGVVYWEPAHIPAPGFGSPWENLALFDFPGNVLSSADAFRPLSDLSVTAGPDLGARGLQVSAYPNPFGGHARIRYDLTAPSHVEFAVYDLLGRRVHGQSPGIQPAGVHEIVLAAHDLASGVYVCEIKVEGRPPAAAILVRRNEL